MGIECQILLTQPKEGIYRCHQPVAGTLNYRINKPTVFEKITVQLKGEGKCTWSEKHGKSHTTYHGNEDYINITKYVVPEGETTIEPGDYSFPFEFIIPSDLPSSFKDYIGSIMYRVVALFHKPGLFGKKEFDTELPFYGYLVPKLDQPIIFGLSKNPFSFTESTVINVKAEVEKTFLTPGENIKMRITIDNQSYVPVTGIQTMLITDITYIANCKRRKKNRHTLNDTIVESEGTERNSTNTYNIVVPTLPNLYTIQYSEIIIVEYQLHLVARLPFPHINASVEIPVVIGEANKESLESTSIPVDKEKEYNIDIDISFPEDDDKDCVKS